MSKRILVCGGRDYFNRSFVFLALDFLHHRRGISCIINGAAFGADELSTDWAFKNNILYEEEPADWLTYGNRAGFIRNALMISKYKPDGVVAFPSNGPGTPMMCDLAHKAGLKVWFPAQSKLINGPKLGKSFSEIKR